MILIGMLSFASGIYLMSFVTTTSLFYIARFLNLFALIPMPTIRSLVSQLVPASFCGTTLTLLQMTLKVAGIAYIPVFTKLYQSSLNWFPGLVFLISSVITVVAMIPVSIVGCRTAQRQQYVRIQGDWRNTSSEFVLEQANREVRLRGSKCKHAASLKLKQGKEQHSFFYYYCLTALIFSVV